MKQVYAQAGIKLSAKAICARRCAVEPANAHMTCIHLMSWNAIVDLTCKFIDLRQNLSSTPKAMAKLQIQSSRKLTLKKSNPDSLLVVLHFLILCLQNWEMHLEAYGLLLWLFQAPTFSTEKHVSWKILQSVVSFCIWPARSLQILPCESFNGQFRRNTLLDAV